MSIHTNTFPFLSKSLRYDRRGRLQQHLVQLTNSCEEYKRIYMKVHIFGLRRIEYEDMIDHRKSRVASMHTT